MPSFVPHCSVLLSAYNGERWWAEHLDSLFALQGVGLRIIVIDDQSSDRTMHLMLAYSATFELYILRAKAERFGNANRNFLRLIRDGDIGEALYMILSICFVDFVITCTETVMLVDAWCLKGSSWMFSSSFHPRFRCTIGG